MIRPPPTSTLSTSSAASDVYKRQDPAHTQAELLWFGSGWVEYRAVSYTHLRGHETPEHLVCRLLLEKKKETVNIKTKSSTKSQQKSLSSTIITLILLL